MNYAKKILELETAINELRGHIAELKCDYYKHTNNETSAFYKELAYANESLFSAEMHMLNTRFIYDESRNTSEFEFTHNNSTTDETSANNEPTATDETNNSDDDF